MHKLTLLVLLMFAAFLVAQSERRKGDDVLNKPTGTIRQAAIEAGGNYITTERNLDGWVEYQNLKSILRDSELVVVGSATENICRISPDQRSVRTVYQFSVETIIKGRIDRTKPIIISLPGGRFTFEDGSTVEVSTPDFKRMVNGTRYLVFLKTNGESYFPTGGSQGIFELKSDGTVLPHAQRHTALASQKGRSHRQVIEEAQRDATEQ